MFGFVGVASPWVNDIGNFGVAVFDAMLVHDGNGLAEGRPVHGHVVKHVFLLRPLSSKHIGHLALHLLACALEKDVAVYQPQLVLVGNLVKEELQFCFQFIHIFCNQTDPGTSHWNGTDRPLLVVTIQLLPLLVVTTQLLPLLTV